MYAWARDAPTLKLPNGVGFKVGGDSQINYLVLQVHYHRMFKGWSYYKYKQSMKSGSGNLSNSIDMFDRPWLSTSTSGVLAVGAGGDSLGLF